MNHYSCLKVRTIRTNYPFGGRFAVLIDTGYACNACNGEVGMTPISLKKLPGT